MSNQLFKSSKYFFFFFFGLDHSFVTYAWVWGFFEHPFMGGNNVLVPQQVQGGNISQMFQISPTDITNLFCQVSWLFSWIEQEEKGKVAEQ